MELLVSVEKRTGKTFNISELIQPSQVVTILNNTTKLVEDVPFPALTLCGSGIHMSNVEKKLVQDIIEWRAEKKKDNTTKEALNEDFYLSDTSEGYAVCRCFYMPKFGCT